MKFNRIINITFFVPLLLLTVSCKKSFFTSVNDNPNVLATVKPNLLLSTIEAGMGYTQGGDVARTACMMVQQVKGTNSQAASFNIYGYTAGSFDAEWADLYTTTLENDFSLMAISDAGQYNQYSGISRIIMAYNLQVMVDQWGAVPYSQSFQANIGGSIHPTYDNAKQLYDTIASLINVGTAFLNNTSTGTIVPGIEDVIYGGNAAQWIKFGHAIKARLYMHQSKGNATMANSALSEIGLAFASTTDNAKYTFGTAETAANPWYQYNRDRADNIEYSTATIASMLTQLNDPRYSIFIDQPNEGSGVLSNGHYGGLNSYYGAVNSPIEYITYDELLFMKAEATLNAGGTVAAAQIAYNAAITANMNKLGVATNDLNSYLLANGTLSLTKNTAIAQIAVQEYFALYLNPEVWTLWRRTGSPALTPTAGSSIPRRLEYPQSEINNNASNVPNSTLFTPKVFWDN